MAGVFDVLKTAEHNQNSAIRPEQETSQDSLLVWALVTTARILRSRMKRKFHVRFCIGGGVGNHPTDRDFNREDRQEREEKLGNLNIRVENLQENLRDFKLSFAASASSR